MRGREEDARSARGRGAPWEKRAVEGRRAAEERADVQQSAARKADERRPAALSPGRRSLL
jgi:hypothetical protein